MTTELDRRSVDTIRALAMDAVAQAQSGHPDAPMGLAALSCSTTIGYPAPIKGGTSAAHGAPLGADEVDATKKSMGWTEPPCTVPRPSPQGSRRD